MSAAPAGIPAPLTDVRVRLAPSPTGSFHIGGARLMMYNCLFAHGQAPREGKVGTVVLRIEDTDQKRLIEGSAENLMSGLRWLGLDWDEGPDVGGPYAPYVQSERKAHYREVAEQLIADGHAYRCFCTPERLQQVREERQRAKLPPGYDRHCRSIAPAEAQRRADAGEPHVVRFRMPLDGETRFVDMLRGEIVYQNSTIDDLVILKADGFPTYHLAVVVDDHDMRITHVTRGPEWIPTAPIHINLYDALGWERPIFAHMPLILSPNGGKLSKRHGAVSVNDFRERGYVPEAIINYMALLGWSLDGKTEIYSYDDLLQHFLLENVSASPSTFDMQKLDWVNAQWINHHLSLDDLTARVIPFLVKDGVVAEGPASPDHPRWPEIRRATGLLKDRIHFLTEASDLMRYLLIDELPPYDPTLLVPKKMTPGAAVQALEAWERVLPTLDLDDLEGSEARLRALAEELSLKPGQLFMPIRVAATGRTQSPGLFETLREIGKARLIERSALALTLLRSQTGDANA